MAGAPSPGATLAISPGVAPAFLPGVALFNSAGMAPDARHVVVPNCDRHHVATSTRFDRNIEDTVDSTLTKEAP